MMPERADYTNLWSFSINTPMDTWRYYKSNIRSPRHGALRDPPIAGLVLINYHLQENILQNNLSAVICKRTC